MKNDYLQQNNKIGIDSRIKGLVTLVLVICLFFMNVFLQSEKSVACSIISGEKETYELIKNNEEDHYGYNHYYKQWNLRNINMPGAWYSAEQFKENDQPIKIAVIDSGVQMSHPDLQGILLTNSSVDVTQATGKGDKYCGGYIKLSELKDKVDEKGQYTGFHGTKVAGVLAAKANIKNRIAGAASCGGKFLFGNNTVNSLQNNAVRIMAIKADSSVNKDRHITISCLTKAIKHAVAYGAEVINLSYSEDKDKFSDDELAAIANALQIAKKCNVTVVCSAGNDKNIESIRYPGGMGYGAYTIKGKTYNLNNIICVGATDKDNNTVDYTNESQAVDIVAPGGAYSISPTTMKNVEPFANGTSYAAPLVSATVALMLKVNYNLKPHQVIKIIKDRAVVDVLGWPGHDVKFKLLNAGRAVTQAAVIRDIEENE